MRQRPRKSSATSLANRRQKHCPTKSKRHRGVTNRRIREQHLRRSNMGHERDQSHWIHKNSEPTKRRALENISIPPEFRPYLDKYAILRFLPAEGDFPWKKQKLEDVKVLVHDGDNQTGDNHQVGDAPVGDNRFDIVHTTAEGIPENLPSRRSNSLDSLDSLSDLVSSSAQSQSPATSECGIFCFSAYKIRALTRCRSFLLSCPNMRDELYVEYGLSRSFSCTKYRAEYIPSEVHTIPPHCTRRLAAHFNFRDRSTLYNGKLLEGHGGTYSSAAENAGWEPVSYRT